MEQFINDFLEKFNEFWNQPLTTILGTIFAGLTCVLAILSKTSIGKKLLNQLSASMTTLKKEWITHKELVETEYKAIDLHLASLYNETKAQLEKTEAHVQELEKLLIDISENIHNSQVIKLLEEYQNGEGKETTNNETTTE